MTGEFLNFACWDPKKVGEVIKTDASSLKPSTLLAVHHHPDAPNADDARYFSDEEVLETLMGPAGIDPAGNLRLLAVIGDSGAGKSHLIQWLRARVVGNSKDVVVYLPRSGTGLRGLLEKLVDALSDAGAEEQAGLLRQQLASAFSANESDGDTAERLLNEMSLQIKHVAVNQAARIQSELVPHGLESAAKISGPAGTPDPGIRRKKARLVGIGEELSHLLLDPASRSWFLGTDGVLARLVAQQFHPDPDPEHMVSVVFTVSDLPSPGEHPDLSRLGGHASDALSSLNSDESLRVTAVELLNRCMIESIPRVFGLSGEHSLTDVFSQARRVLRDRGNQMILLVEDLSRLQGIDSELLNAIANPGEEDGVIVSCPLRVAVAVTSGYYESLDETFKTRVEKTFDLSRREESIVGKSAETNLGEFASGYLNAVRIGQMALSDGFDQANEADQRGRNWVVNACDGCAHRTECHRSFGSVDGIGLYPFNTNALENMTYSAFREENGNGQFNPRRLLRRVLYRVLADPWGTALTEGSFPPLDLEREFSEARILDPQVSLGMSGVDAVRQRTILRFWSKNGAPGYEVNSGVFEAFGATPFGVPGPTGVTGPTEKSEAEITAEWAGGKPLPRALADDFKRSLYDAAIKRVAWARLGVEPQNEYFVGGQKKEMVRAFSRFSIEIEGELSGGTYGSTEVDRSILRADSEFLTRLALARMAGGALVSSEDTYFELQDFVEKLADEVSGSVEGMLWKTDPKEAPYSLVPRLALTAIAAGVGAHDLPQLSVGLLQTGATPVPQVSARWIVVMKSALEKRRELAVTLLLLAESRQGNAHGPGIIRAGRIIFYLEAMLDAWDFPTGKINFANPALTTSLSELRRREVVNGLDAELRGSGERLNEVDELFGDESWDPVALAESLHTAVTAADRIQRFPGNPNHARELIDQLKTLSVDELPVLPQGELSLTEKLTACVEVAGSSRVQSFGLVNELDELIGAAVNNVKVALDAYGADGTGGVDELEKTQYVIRAAIEVLEKAK
jgi:hypothetical protein